MIENRSRRRRVFKKRIKKVVVTKNLIIFMSISSMIAFAYGLSSSNIICLLFPLSIFYIIREGVLVFPCYLIIDIHFIFWLSIFLSRGGLLWPSSFVFMIYFGLVIFKRKKNFAELNC